VKGFSDSKPNVPKIIFFECLVVTTKTRLTFVIGLSLLFDLVSCMSAVEAKQSLSCCLACQQQHGHASLQGANSFTEKDICLK
jgi:hypothetical protein